MNWDMDRLFRWKPRRRAAAEKPFRSVCRNSTDYDRSTILHLNHEAWTGHLAIFIPTRVEQDLRVVGHVEAETLHLLRKCLTVDLAHQVGDVFGCPGAHIALDRIMGRLALEGFLELLRERTNARYVGCRCRHANMRNRPFRSTTGQFNDLGFGEGDLADKRHRKRLLLGLYQEASGFFLV